MIVKLNTIKPEIKERVLLLYLNRMKFYFTIKTLKWFLLFRSDDYDLEDVSIPSPYQYVCVLIDLYFLDSKPG